MLKMKRTTPAAALHKPFEIPIDLQLDHKGSILGQRPRWDLQAVGVAVG